jgi:uncharacterized protein DUF1203
MATTDTTTTFQIHAISSEVLQAVRARGVDAGGNPLEHVVADGGEPLRCCLRDAGNGEALILFGYEPPLPASPYREVGPVYTHAHACAGPKTNVDYPADWYGRPQVLRAYDGRGWIHEARVHDGSDPAAEISDMLADPDVAQIHSRNVAHGCYMFTITRSSAMSPSTTSG